MSPPLKNRNRFNTPQVILAFRARQDSRESQYTNHSEIVSFLWGVADLIRDTFNGGKYQDFMLPLPVLAGPTAWSPGGERFASPVKISSRLVHARFDPPVAYCCTTLITRGITNCRAEPLEGFMKHRPLLHTLLGLSWLTLTSCASETTEPNPAPTAAGPELAVASSTWLTKGDMPYGRVSLTTAVVPNAAGQSILYAIGGAGLKYGFSLDRVHAYNVATNTWSGKARLPVPLYGTNGTGVVNGKIYVSGGFYYDEEEWGPTGYLFVYDPLTNSWTRKAYMPEMGASGVTGVIRGKLYVLSDCFERVPLEYYYGDCGEVEGGRPAGQNFFRYNPVTDRWARLPSPNGEYHMGGVLDGKLYVTDGKNLGAYDPVTNQWTTKTTGGQVRGRAAATVHGGMLYLIGGRQLTSTGWKTVRTTKVYHPNTNTWTAAAPMPTARSDISASRVFLNGKPRIEVVGGSAPGNNLQYIP